MAFTLATVACALGSTATARLPRPVRAGFPPGAGLGVPLGAGPTLRLLGAPEPGVQAVGRQELLVASPLGDPPPVDDRDLVGSHDGGQPVGDDDDGAAVRQARQGSVYLALGLRVGLGGGSSRMRIGAS